MLHKRTTCSCRKGDGQLVVELPDLLCGELAFDPRNAGCSGRLNKFDSFVCVRIGVYRSQPAQQGLIIVHTQHYTAVVTPVFPAPPYPHLPGIKPESLHSRRTNSEYQRLTIPLKERAGAQADLLRAVTQKPYRNLSSGKKHYVVILCY